MCFSDARFAYGPFVPHHVARQYIESYFALHRTDALLRLGTTVEDMTTDAGKWRLVLRRRNGFKGVDEWWRETFDAVVIATGHYSVPYVRHKAAFLLVFLLR